MLDIRGRRGGNHPLEKFGAFYATLRYSTLLYATLRYSTLLYATLRYSTLLYATLRYSTLRYATLRYFTLLYATLRYSTLLYATLRYSTNLGFYWILRCVSKNTKIELYQKKTNLFFTIFKKCYRFFFFLILCKLCWADNMLNWTCMVKKFESCYVGYDEIGLLTRLKITSVLTRVHVSICTQGSKSQCICLGYLRGKL
jgi:hypothetical protein